ncbi:MAG: SRPBCC family protein [Lacibacter sp.]
MTTQSNSTITVRATVQATVEKVWILWTSPEHIIHWNNASPDWHTPKAESDLRPGGKFSSRMEAKDGSFGFDFGGVFDEVCENELLSYTIADGRKVVIHFSSAGESTLIVETFEAENENPPELQQQGWQAILDNFKKYAESII